MWPKLANEIREFRTGYILLQARRVNVMLFANVNGLPDNLTNAMDPKSHPALPGYQQTVLSVNPGYLRIIFT